MSGGAPEFKKVQKGESLWLMSFSDMSLVLLCFFILLISMMKPDRSKFEHMKGGMSQRPTEETLKSYQKRIEKVIKERKLEKAASVEYDADGLVIEFKDGMMFYPGSAEYNPQTRKTIQEVVKAIASAGTRYKMVVEGHTDHSPLKSVRFPSNWELSASRGFTIMRDFHKLGVAEDHISVEAYAHTKPKVPYANVKGEDLRAAMAANRRVVIRIE